VPKPGVALGTAVPGAVLQRVSDLEQVMPGRALVLVLQDWLLAVENHRYNPDATHGPEGAA
ncbi:MAG: hypothetical protein ABI779_18410, partial [Acidobacteriota bacterium]